MDNVRLKNQEWAVNHEYVTDSGVGIADTEAADEAAYLASLSKKVGVQPTIMQTFCFLRLQRSLSFCAGFRIMFTGPETACQVYAEARRRDGRRCN